MSVEWGCLRVKKIYVISQGAVYHKHLKLQSTEKINCCNPIVVGFMKYPMWFFTLLVVFFFDVYYLFAMVLV